MSEYWIRAYQQHYYRVLIPEIYRPGSQSATLDWNEYHHTEWVADFMRPQNTRYTAVILNPYGISFSINRSDDMPPFRAVELKTLEVISGHLTNYWRMLNSSNQDRSYPDAADIHALYPVLTRRESEITALFCRKYSAEMIASRLLISPHGTGRGTN